MKKLISSALAASLLFSGAAFASNPEITETAPGEIVYGGDPAALVVDSNGDGEGDTVYLYIGNDAGDGTYYNMPKYLCYSSTDMVNWTYEGSPMSANDFSWGGSNQSWAGQVVEYNGTYYFYMCKNASGISVGVSDSPTGPFTPADNGSPIISPGWTNGKVGWDDIDPTIWIENDENGDEHRYIAWGNSNLYMAELDETMVSLTDKNGDGYINGGDITELTVNGIPSGSQYTEAPWLYKRDGKYYMFFATNWREELSYATADNIWGPYEYAGLVMRVGASSNTNHPAVIDFKGETYFIYHTGALERGSGYLRSVCIDRLVFDENGGVAQLEENSAGLDGTAVKLRTGGEYVFHTHFANSTDDTAYPMGATLKLGGSSLYETDSLWEIVPGLIEGGSYVSIQSVNKMGYYVTEYDGYIKLLHDDDGTTESKTDRTFIAVESDEGTAFESLSMPGKYLGVKDGFIALIDEPVYFEICARTVPTLSADTEADKIVVSGSSEPNADLIVILRNESSVLIGYAKTDGEGKFAYTFSPTEAGKYEITAAGITITAYFGGAE